jgi:valyl-tRNA synthetase
VRAVVTRVRNFRLERGTSPTERVELWIDPESPDPALASEVAQLSSLAVHLARLSRFSFATPPAGAVRDVVSGIAVGLGLGEKTAKADDGKRERTLVVLDGEIEELATKLRNPSFLDKAPPAIVDKTRRRLVELEERRAALSGGPA